MVSIRSILTFHAQQVLDDMVAALSDRKSASAQEIKFPLSTVEDFDQWEISSWSTLDLVPKNQSSTVEQRLALEDGELEPETDNKTPLSLLAMAMPGFHALIPKHHLENFEEQASEETES